MKRFLLSIVKHASEQFSTLINIEEVSIEFCTLNGICTVVVLVVIVMVVLKLLKVVECETSKRFRVR